MHGLCLIIGGAWQLLLCSLAGFRAASLCALLNHPSSTVAVIVACYEFTQKHNSCPKVYSHRRGIPMDSNIDVLF